MHDHLVKTLYVNVRGLVKDVLLDSPINLKAALQSIPAPSIKSYKKPTKADAFKHDTGSPSIWFAFQLECIHRFRNIDRMEMHMCAYRSDPDNRDQDCDSSVFVLLSPRNNKTIKTVQKMFADRSNIALRVWCCL